MPRTPTDRNLQPDLLKLIKDLVGAKIHDRGCTDPRYRQYTRKNQTRWSLRQSSSVFIPSLPGIG